MGEETKNEYKEGLEKDFRLATEIKELLAHPAWHFVEESYLWLLKSLDTLKGVDMRKMGAEEVMGRQLAIGILEQWWSDLNGIDLATIKEKIENLNKKTDIIKFHP